MTGPRQVGKTTLVRQLFPEHQEVLLDDLAILKLAKQDPTLFVQNFPAPAIYDEVQRAGELFLSIKAAIDQKGSSETAQYVLTGSQPLSLMQGVADSLAGRVGILELSPMTYAELQETTTNQPRLGDILSGNVELSERYPLERPIQDLLFRGGFPRMAIEKHSPTDEDVVLRFENYIKTYLQKDLRELSLVKEINEFERFVRRFSLSSASIKGPSEWAGDLSKPRSTINAWLGLLCASYLAIEIPAYARKLGRREKKASKYALTDAGLMSHLLSYREPRQVLTSPVVGQIFETYAIQAFRASLASEGLKPQLYHWRADEKRKVDLVLELSSHDLVAIEFKMSSHPSSDDLVGIHSFKKHYPECQRAYIVSCFDQLVEIERGVINIPISLL